MTFKWNRLDVCCGTVSNVRLEMHQVEDAEGEYVLAQEAIDREAVNADKIRTLEVQLKEARLRANRLDRLLSQKNQALVEVREIVQRTFDLKE